MQKKEKYEQKTKEVMKERSKTLTESIYLQEVLYKRDCY